jgi:hypothetical protein
MKPLSSSFAMFAARFNSHVGELTEMSKPHLPSHKDASFKKRGLLSGLIISFWCVRNR